MSDSNRKIPAKGKEPLYVKVAKRAFEQKYGCSPMRTKTAGEIRFVKDQGPEEREIPSDFAYKAKYVKPLNKIVWSLSCAMGHLTSAQSDFNKIKAVNISPDGKLGGKGYIQPISEIRTNLAQAVETISNTIDTIHDEVNGDHWKPTVESLSPSDKAEVEELQQDSEEIIEDPESYADKEYKEEVLDDVE